MGPGLHLDGDRFWHFIRSGAIPPYLAASHRQNEVVVAAVGAAAAAYARGGYTTVLDTIVGPWFLERTIAAALDAEVPVHYVVLRPSYEAAVARATARTGDALRDEGVLAKMYAAFTELGPFEAHVVDTTALTADETAQQVVARVASGASLVDRAAFRLP